MTEGASAPRVDDAGRQIGRFTVLKEAGAGAMGVVYAAYDGVLDRRVALKVLRGQETARRQERARREALALARVSHPNVVQIFEVDEADGQFFVAMEYIDGETLREWLTASRPWQVVLEAFVDIGAGLAAAHEAGLVHRDFKPNNVLVGVDGRPRIIDFGLARGWEDAPPAPIDMDAAMRLSQTLTRTGAVLGTPAYMAPELLDGGSSTPASDQFAFCVAAFEALYGQVPFPRDSLPIMRRALTQGPVGRPSAAGVPRGLYATLCRGLAADPEERWPSMAALLGALSAQDPRRADASLSWRTRAFLAICFTIGLVHNLVRALTEGPPSPVDVLYRELVVLGAGGTILLVAHLSPGTDAHDRRLLEMGWLLVGTKLVAVSLGVHLGMTTLQIFAVDLIIISSVMVAVHLLVMRLLWGWLAMIGVVFAGVAIWPEYTVIWHHGAGVAFMVGFVHANWSLR